MGRWRGGRGCLDGCALMRHYIGFGRVTGRAKGQPSVWVGRVESAPNGGVHAVGGARVGGGGGGGVRGRNSGADPMVDGDGALRRFARRRGRGCRRSTPAPNCGCADIGKKVAAGFISALPPQHTRATAASPVRWSGLEWIGLVSQTASKARSGLPSRSRVGALVALRFSVHEGEAQGLAASRRKR